MFPTTVDVTESLLLFKHTKQARTTNTHNEQASHPRTCYSGKVKGDASFEIKLNKQKQEKHYDPGGQRVQSEQQAVAGAGVADLRCPH